jgi:ABC-2 type transport system permease protein
VILPLSFLGGVFYSVDRLPDPVACALARQSALVPDRRGPPRLPRRSDVPLGLSLGVAGAMAAFFVAWSAWLFATGRRLKP